MIDVEDLIWHGHAQDLYKALLSALHLENLTAEDREFLRRAFAKSEATNLRLRDVDASFMHQEMVRDRKALLRLETFTKAGLMFIGGNGALVLSPLGTALAAYLTAEGNIGTEAQ